MALSRCSWRKAGVMPLAFSAARTPGRCDWNFESKSCSAGKTSNSAPRLSSFQIRTLSSMKSMMPMKVSSLPRGNWMGAGSVVSREQLFDSKFQSQRPGVRAALKASGITPSFLHEHRDKAIAYIAEHDEELFAKYSHNEPLLPEELRAGLRRATVGRKLVPVLCGASFKNKGVQTLLDAIVDYLPSPLDVPPMQGTAPGREE